MGLSGECERTNKYLSQIVFLKVWTNGPSISCKKNWFLTRGFKLVAMMLRPNGEITRGGGIRRPWHLFSGNQKAVQTQGFGWSNQLKWIDFQSIPARHKKQILGGYLRVHSNG